MADIGRAWDILQDQSQPRAIDEVLQRAEPGDAVILVRGPGAPDDDKRHTSAVLWRISPFTDLFPMDTQINPAFEGHPYLINGIRFYTFAHPRRVIADITAPRIFTILYNGAEQNPERIPAHEEQGQWRRSGADLWRGPNGP